MQPIRLDDAAAIDVLLQQLRRAICAGGTAWVDKAVRRQEGDSARCDRMLDEGWDE